jgi:hypothetical protein
MWAIYKGKALKCQQNIFAQAFWSAIMRSIMGLGVRDISWKGYYRVDGT